MRVLVLVKATQDSESGAFDPQWMAGVMAAMGRFNDELQAAGVLVTADGLAPTAHGKRIVYDGAERQVIAGPFTPAHEQVAGFWLWEVRDMDEAADWARRCPNPMPGRSEIEIRPMHDGSGPG